jgi:hypothetical protein
MTGVIWFVQVVHYPLFGLVGTTGFSDYEKAHNDRTSYVVVLPMLVQLITGLALVWSRPEQVTGLQVGLDLALLALVWVSTFWLQVPQHRRLLKGYDASSHKKLVQTNWIRTLGWTCHAGLVLWMIRG